MKSKASWYSERLNHQTQLVRWGHYGRAVLLFPTAGGDAEEIERMLMIRALTPLLEAGRIKIYSVDSLAAQTWGNTAISARQSSRIQNCFDAYIYKEVIPAIRQDCEDEGMEVVSCGASIGAFNALASLCRHPDVFKQAICLSGTYDVERFIKEHDGHPMRRGNLDFYFSSPLQYLPALKDGPQLRQLQQRFVLMAHGGGRWEDPDQDWRMASILGSKGVPNRVDPWGPEFDHDWPTWRELLPKYLSEIE